MTGSTPSHGYSFVSYTNYLNQQQCLTLPPAEEVACVSQHLNITEPPSVYTYTDYTSLWDPVTCLLWNVTLHERIDAAGEGGVYRESGRGTSLSN